MESKKAHLCVMCLFISVSDNNSKGSYLFKTPNINSLYVFIILNVLLGLDIICKKYKMAMNLFK